MENSYEIGVGAEKTAYDYLCKKGYKILFVRYKTEVGEIDIVAEKNRIVAIVEVKKRKNLSNNFSDFEVVSRTQQLRIANAANILIANENDVLQNCDFRFDAIIIGDNDKIYHIEKAWEV